MTFTVSNVFLDTNVLVYVLDSRSPAKQARAIALLSDPNHSFAISTQVMLELFSVTTRKFVPALSPTQATALVHQLRKFTVITADASLVVRAAQTVIEHQLSIWDAMILEAARQGNCEELWTEDLTAGAVLRDVKIVNPFDGL